jgi:hypothetical protein
VSFSSDPRTVVSPDYNYYAVPAYTEGDALAAAVYFNF